MVVVLDERGMGEISAIDVGTLPGSIQYSTMSTCSRLSSLSAGAPGYCLRGVLGKGFIRPFCCASFSLLSLHFFTHRSHCWSDRYM